MCTSPVSLTCINSIPTVSVDLHSLPCLLFRGLCFSLPRLSPPQLPDLTPPPHPHLRHIFLHPSPVSLPLFPSIFPFPTSRPTSLFIQACPSIPSSTHLSIHPIPHSPFPNPAERDPRHPVHPSLPCLRAPSFLLFHLVHCFLVCTSRARIKGGKRRGRQKRGRKWQ